jgi:Fe-S cluster assembly protein SufB
MATTELDIGRYQLGWSDEEDYVFKPRKGLSEEIVREMSAMKHEPEWMLKFRLSSLKRFYAKPMMPWFAIKMPQLDFDDIYYYIKPTDKQVNNWDELPDNVKNTWEKLGIPEAERKHLAGVTAQYECLRGSTRVWTDTGMRSIKEIEAGDVVFSLDETSRQIVRARVVGQACSGDKEIFEIKARGRVIGASANHPFLVLRDVRKPGRQRARLEAQWLPVEQLCVGDVIAVASDVPAFKRPVREPAMAGATARSDGLRDNSSEVLESNARSEAVTEPRFRTYTSDSLGYVRIESIESVGIEPTYDIEVEGHHNFVAEGFIAHNSEVVYHRNRADLEASGVLFCDMDTAVREYPDVVRKWFGKIIPPADNKFSALNSAVWSGGSFIYVPPGVKVEMPLQAYFRINAENMGQFERTLIIADEGSQVHYVEGCSAPVYSTDSLHSAVVELVALPGSRITYTTIQNWSTNVYNLVTKRARAEAEAHVEWIDGNIGSRLTMKYPSVYLMGPKASGEVLSVAYAGAGQQQDTGAKMFHCAPETTSTIVSKSICKDGGNATYRGKVHVDEGARRSKSFVRCDALILDEESVSETKPYIEVQERDAQIGHEATVSKVGDDQLFYLMSRGLSENQAMGMIVNGFIEPVTRTLPMEYAVEWSRLIELQMDGSVG